MNNKHILDLTLRLSQALDQNYDVVSMETVLSVISALEGTTITKEQLEATRLAKYINQLRRRTKCENLARRAKSLLKRWREMVGMQQSYESSSVPGVANTPIAISTGINSSSAASVHLNIPVSDDAVCTSSLTNPQFSQHDRRQQQNQNNINNQIQQQSYHSQPSTPVNPKEKSDPNEFLITLSNPATGAQMQKISNPNVRKKVKIDENIDNEQIIQQPTSFANLITKLGSTFGLSRKTTGSKSEETVNPVETFIIEHSSNSNSDLICIPSIHAASSNYTSATDVPPVVIDLQDTNSSMNSLVSKDVTNASSSLHRNKTSTRKSKKEKKRKDRSATARQNQPLPDCDDQNTTNASYHHKQPSDILLLDEKSHSVCPTTSNISEILSLSNSSMSSVFPSADAMSKNIFQSAQNELVSSSVQMSKSDLTFAGKFKQHTTSTASGCNALNYNNDSMSIHLLDNNSPNQNKFSPFCGIGTTNSNDSCSTSRTSSVNDLVLTVKTASNSRHNIEDGSVKNDINEKSISNMSDKGNSSTDNAFAIGASNIAGHQQSIDLTRLDFSSQKAVKQPKKRGRKKGSKGVDSVIAKETSLSSQMLISSIGVAGKKVKTTKELYAEMENRKFRNAKVTETSGNSSAYCIGKQHKEKTDSSRRPSFSSVIAETDSCSMTSEPSRDSGNNLSKATIGKRETPLDNINNYSKNVSESQIVNAKSDENFAVDISSKIKLEIEGILKLLPSPPSVKQIEYECLNSITPCTCTIEEVTDIADNESTECIGNNSKHSNFYVTNSTNISEKDCDHLKRIQMEQMVNMTGNLKRTDNDLKNTLHQQPPLMKVKKSIFDLDFDDDEDPLNSITADIVGKNFKPEKKLISSPVTDDKSELPLITEDDLSQVDHQNTPYVLNVPTATSDNILFPSYEIKFSPDCEAKNRFEVQTQKITKFHIDTLHNCFIPNVNGNWNHGNADGTRNCEDDPRKSDLIIDGYDVVPFYGTDMNEKIIKDLSHIHFTKNFKINHSKCQNQNEILYNIPFLGVSRIPDIADTKLNSKGMKNITNDEEKENVNNELNFKNIIPNTSALDITDAKERGVMEMESVLYTEASSITPKLKANKNTKRSGFKRTKKQQTSVKRATVKRPKLGVNRNLEANSRDSDKVFGLKLHSSLFYHEELYPFVQSGPRFYRECIFHISSCSSGNNTDEEATNSSLSCRKRTTLSSSSSTSSSSSPLSSSEYPMLNSQREIIKAELEKVFVIENSKANATSNELATDVSAMEMENDEKDNNSSTNNSNNDGDNNHGNDLPEENNRMLLSFNNIYNKSTRNENIEQQNKDRENNMLKQQIQNCDDYNNLNNNFNLIKYIDNKTSSVNNINNNTNSCSNNLSDTSINISSSSCNHENPTDSTLNQIRQLNNNDNDVQIQFKEYQTTMHAVDEDVNDADGNNCVRLQPFKEWHEVLQLRSYNDELLTVLPYVVLE